MNYKRILSMLLTACLLISVLPGVTQAEHTHTFGAATTSGDVTSRSCTTCGYTEAVYEQKDPVSQPVIGNTYYLAANANGVLKYFTTGTVTTTAPYSLVTTEQEGTAVQVTLEDSTKTSENFEGGFQLTYDNKGALTRIYCMDVLKDATTAGQTGVMDTGANSSTPYKNRHSFFVDEVDGVKVLRKYGNNNILVVKLFDSTGTYRMLGVPEAELANEGVYPVMLLQEHTHSYESGDCICGKKAPTLAPMTDPEAAVGSSRIMYLYAEDGDGVAHYMRQAKGAAASSHGYAEKVTTTSPYSIYTTTDIADAEIYSVVKATCDTATETEYMLQYTNSGITYTPYLMTSGVGPNKTESETHAKHHYLWDAENKYFYQMESSVKYVLVMKNMAATYAKTSTLPAMTQNEWRITCAPVADLEEEGVYPVNLGYHDHTYVEGKCVCGEELEAIPLNEGIYYLKATLGGTTYYFRRQTTGESVTHTSPYSLYTDADKAKATLVDVIKETSGGYSLAYPQDADTARIYVYDVGSDGTIDTGVNAKNVEANHHFRWDGYNGRFYQMEGSVKYVLSIKELDNTNTDTKQIRMLAVPESALSDTVVPVKLEAHPTHTVDTWEVTTPPTTSTTGVKTGTCTVCEREVQAEVPVLLPSFSGNDISLSDAFSLRFYVDKAAFADGVYQYPYVVFLADGAETTVSDYTEDEDSYIFTYDDITPDKMGETVKATLYADKAGVYTAYATKEYSVAQYCYDMLEKENTTDALRTLLVDTLHFGAACQQYRGSTAELVNAKLTEAQKAWGSADPLRALTTCKDFGDNDGEVKWYGVSALMGSRVQMRVYFEAEDTTGLVVWAKWAGKARVMTNIQSADGKYYVDFNALTPTQMSETVTFTAYRNDAAVSTDMRYSMESYAESWLRRSDASDAQKALVTAMIRYGDAAKAYVDRVYDLNEDVLYMGRTYERNDTQWFNWSASGFSVQFQGSGIKATIASNAPNATNYAYLKVYVDGVEQEEDVLLDKTMQTITLAEGLDPEKTHTVEVRKRNTPRSSTAGLLTLELTDGKKLARPAAKEKLIEFVGDSLTVGYSASDEAMEETKWSTKTEDGTRTYSKQVADAFGAEYMVTAISGRGIVMNNQNAGAPWFKDIYPKLDYYNDKETEYDFSLQPDVIVINLGSNDATNADLDLDVFQAGVVSFIQLVREKNPNAKIVWAYGMRWISADVMHTEVGERIEAAIAEAGDPEVYYVPLEAVDSNTEIHITHPIASSYAPRGEAIIAKIKEITGWQ